MKRTRCASLVGMLTLAAVLAGCGSTPAPQYYSLVAPGAVAPERASAGPVKSAYAISVQPVVVPEQVARPQIVVSTPAATEVVPLNSTLWASPLEAQIRNALSDALTRRLNVVDVGQSGAGEGLPVWRVYVDVQRFDSLYDEAVQHDVVWRMVPQGMRRGAKERLCSAEVHVRVGTGMSALVEGHRQALETLAELMTRTLPASTGGKNAVPLKAPDGAVFKGCVG